MLATARLARWTDVAAGPQARVAALLGPLPAPTASAARALVELLGPFAELHLAVQCPDNRGDAREREDVYRAAAAYHTLALTHPCAALLGRWVGPCLMGPQGDALRELEITVRSRDDAALAALAAQLPRCQALRVLRLRAFREGWAYSALGWPQSAQALPAGLAGARRLREVAIDLALSVEEEAALLCELARRVLDQRAGPSDGVGAALAAPRVADSVHEVVGQGVVREVHELRQAILREHPRAFHAPEGPAGPALAELRLDRSVRCSAAVKALGKLGGAQLRSLCATVCGLAHFAEGLRETPAGKPALRTLVLRAGAREVPCAALLAALNAQTQLERLSLGLLNLRGLALRLGPGLRELELVACELCPRAVRAIGGLVGGTRPPRPPTLERLALERCCCEESLEGTADQDPWLPIARAVQTGRLVELRMCAIGVGPATVSAMAEALSAAPGSGERSLQVLQLRGNPAVGDAAAAKLLYGCRGGALQEIDLAGCGLGEQASAALAEVLLDPRCALRSVGVAGADLRHAAAQLASATRAIAHSGRLRRLDLSCCQLQPELVRDVKACGLDPGFGFRFPSTPASS